MKESISKFAKKKIRNKKIIRNDNFINFYISIELIYTRNNSKI